MDASPNLAAMEQDYSREVYFRRRNVNPPGMVYVTVDDLFVLKVFNPSVAANVNVSIRYLTAEGEVLPQFQQFQNIPVSSTPRTFNFRGSEGYVLSATISTPGASAGAVYVQLEVGRGAGSQDLTEGHLLIAGYPGSFAALGYPQTQPLPPSAGAGVSRTVTIGSAAAGADFTVNVPPGVIWQLISVTATLVTSATVANRFPFFRAWVPGGYGVVYAGAAFTQPASVTWNYSFGVGFTVPASGGTSNGAGITPGNRLPGGGAFGTLTTNLQAADQWQSISYTVIEFVAG